MSWRDGLGRPSTHLDHFARALPRARRNAKSPNRGHFPPTIARRHGARHLHLHRYIRFWVLTIRDHGASLVGVRVRAHRTPARIGCDVMNGHGMDGGAVAPETGGTGPGGAVGTPGGPVAPGGAGRGVAVPVRPVAPGASGGAPGAPDGDAIGRVWAVLMAASDAVSAREVALSAALPYTGAVAALLCFEQAALALRIAGHGGRDSHPDLWVLAGGVREGAAVAEAVVVGPQTGIPVLAKGELQDRVLELLIEYYPDELGPQRMAQLLGGRSHGAVRNAADALCKRGLAVCTDYAVRRYAALSPGSAPVEADAGGSEPLA